MVNLRRARCESVVWGIWFFGAFAAAIFLRRMAPARFETAASIIELLVVLSALPMSMRYRHLTRGTPEGERWSRLRQRFFLGWALLAVLALMAMALYKGISAINS